MKRYKREFIEEVKSQDFINSEEVKSLYKKLGGHLDVLKGTKSSLTKNQMEKKIGTEIVGFLHDKVKQMKAKDLSDKEIKNEILKMKKLPGDGVFRSEITRYLSLYFK